MKTQPVLVGVTVINMVLLALSLAGARAGEARDVAPVLRGRAFEIVDDRGHVRAGISVLPAVLGFKMPDGTTGSPETVLFRLTNSKGRPNVKIESTDKGAAVYLGGEEDPTNILLGAQGPASFVSVTNKDGRRHEIKP